MKFERAAAIAQDLASEKNEPYAVVQANNGQWMVEQVRWLWSPEGQKMYFGKARALFESKRH